MKHSFALVLLLAAASSLAGELLPVRQDRELGARIEGIAYPASLRRDLTSGLTNRLLIRITLRDEAQELARKAVEIAIRYDLWEENFTMTTRVDGAVVNTTVHQSVQQVMDLLQQLNLPRLFTTGGVRGNGELIMQADLLLNPIDRERMEAIRKWVAQNSVRRSLDPAGAAAAGEIPLSNAIFNRIFEQYASGSDVAAAWQQTLNSKPFRLESLTP